MTRKISNFSKTITYAQILNKATNVFQHDRDKAMAWYLNEQEDLENKKPYQMIKAGEGRKLMQYLERYEIMGVPPPLSIRT